MGSNLDKLNDMTSKEASGWFEKAKRREKYRLWYDFKFEVQLQWIMFKRYMGWKKKE